VVGVTRYCDYPPDALRKAKVGGYSDPNYEAIAMLKPDLVVALPEHDAFKRSLEQLALNTLSVDHRNIRGILDSLSTLGKRCGAALKARAIVADIERRRARIREKTHGLSRPRVLISVGRSMHSSSLSDVYCAGRDTFYDELLSLAGGTNAYQGQIVRFPSLSVEGILRLNPEVVIDIIPGFKDEAMALRAWSNVSKTNAAKNNRMHVFGDMYAARPGPRFILLLEAMAQVIHPELDWD